MTKFQTKSKLLKISKVNNKLFNINIFNLEGKSQIVKEIEKEVDSFFDIFKEEEKSDEKTKSQVDASEGEFFKNDLIPFSIEYYLQLVDLTRFCGDEDCDSHH
jgi:hypothetical protein